MQTPQTSPILTTHPALSFTRGQYTYKVETRAGQTTYTVADASRSISLPILWSFGAANQTWVFERDGNLYESLVSFYKSIDKLDITTGDDKEPTSTLEQAAGRELSPAEVKVCFGCHSANSSVNGKVNFAAMHPGLSCVNCHTEAPMHLASVLKGTQDSIPASLGALSSGDMSDFCGKCHRSWEKVVRNHWYGEFNVRFQPYRLANSKCFDGNDPRISCVACHNPHLPLAQEATYYDKKCLACHSGTSQTASAAPSANPRTCPVAKTNCVSCHMPRLKFPGGPAFYTDHQIRIVRAGEPYPN